MVYHSAIVIGWIQSPDIYSKTQDTRSSSIYSSEKVENIGSKNGKMLIIG